ncbi:gamma-glutamyltransferase [Tsuneonella sp. CC-YZS046]|uniref:gamma-glutamyltransferase n=1 Tax=Tsuneonella sp. CC-YZS046 TaxID=3042152 RepID=UPI002D789151|nr:gamma-glutamyltransferase [Tsuneonella sp. CC-YZS046]WRO65998.1 gamma-glutamyltransferase [Tsuneonella sp. CC-YZS046]
MLKRFFSSLSALLLITACATAPQAAEPQTASGSGLVSAADPRAADAGARMLRLGGNATDAAIATMLALTVVEPQSSGIGGGGFFVRGTPQGDVATLDGRETAPAAAKPDWFMKDGKPLPFDAAVLSGLSVGVPGNIALAAEAHRRFGKLGWAQLFEPAIALAEEGFRISPRLHDFLIRNPERAAHGESGKRLFYDEQGQPLPIGTLVLNPQLADSLREIAVDGPRGFYEGRQAKALASAVAAATPHPGKMQPSDLAAYAAKERPALCGLYRGWRICGMGPPSSGATTVFAILKQLEGFDLAGLGSASPIAWHLIAESQRLAYADRERYLADPDFVRVPVEGLAKPDYLAARGGLIDPVDAMASVEPGRPDGAPPPAADGVAPEEGGTSHFVAVDGGGTAVSYTSTIEGAFGSGIVVGGYYLNNELTDFSFIPDRGGQPVANRVEGGKRPRSSMAPTVAYAPDGRLAVAVGAAGGATIPAQVARVLIGLIDWGLTVEQALALPVIFAPGDTVYVEAGSTLEDMMPSLRELGHKEVLARDLPLKANAAAWTASGWQGAADPRSEGAIANE